MSNSSLQHSDGAKVLRKSFPRVSIADNIGTLVLWIQKLYFHLLVLRALSFLHGPLFSPPRVFSCRPVGISHASSLPELKRIESGRCNGT